MKKTLQKTILIMFAFYILVIAIITARKQTDQYLYIKEYYNRPNSKVVTYRFCYDGDTAAFEGEDGVFIKCRFLNVDSPEYDEPFGKEAKEYAEGVLKRSMIIEIESDPNSREYDEYGRYLVYVFADGVLLNEKLVEEGLAYNRYGRDNYRYYNDICDAEKNAKNKKIGIWSKN